jgi:capsular polysaccharide transport system permease protein
METERTVSKSRDVAQRTSGSTVKQLRFALIHAARMSQAISDTARRARFSTRYYRISYAGGFRARRGERLFKQGVLISFVLLVIVPSIASIAYFGVIAAPQYISEARLTLSGAETSAADNGAGLQIAPVSLLAQDTQVVQEFLRSRAMVAELSHAIDIRGVYDNAHVDWLARLSRDASLEDLHRHWKWMTRSSIELPGGIIDFSVRAFSPLEAAKLAQAALMVSETMVNELNARMLRDTVGRATEDLKGAADRLAAARIKLEQARNRLGMLSADRQADSINELLVSVQAGRIALQQEYDSRRRFISPSQPEMRTLRAQMRAADTQITNLKSQLTDTRFSVSSTVVAAAMSQLAELDLNRRIAEQQYSLAATALESARIAAVSKFIYLNSFVDPAPGHLMVFPSPIEEIAISIVGALIVWGTLVAAATFIRNNMA